MKLWVLGFDVVAVVGFVVVGRDTHNEGNAIADVLETAAPFLIALLWGWVATRAWVAPTSVSVGSGVALATVALGVAMRRLLFGDGIAFVFIIVTAAFFALTMVGWRLLWRILQRSETIPA